VISFKKKNQASTKKRLSQTERTQPDSSSPQDRGHVVNPASTNAKAPLSSFKISWQKVGHLTACSKDTAEYWYMLGQNHGKFEAHNQRMQTGWGE